MESVVMSQSTASVLAQLDQQIIPVRACPHPLRVESVDLLVEEGRSLADILIEVQPDPILRLHAHVFINDALMPRECWAFTYPSFGDTITIRIVPADGGGGKSPLRIVLTVAVIAAAAFAGPAGASALGFEGVAASSVVGGLISAAVGTIGMLVVNAIAPPPKQDLGVSDAQLSQANNIAGARNRANPFGVIPKILGTHRVVPALGALPFTEIEGDDQYVRMVFVWGYGELEVTDIKIGETPIGNFQDVDIETQPGASTNEPLTLFPDTVVEQNPNADISVGETTSGPGAWSATFTSEPDTDELSFDWTFPQGLIEFEDDGDRKGAFVEVEINWREVGAGIWNSITRRTDGHRTSIIRRGRRVAPGFRGQFEGRMRVLSSKADDGTVKTTVWTAFRSIKNEDPIQFDKPIAKTAVRIRATDQLNGIIDQLSGLCKSKVLDWNGASWVSQASNNPASLYRDVLQGEGNSDPVDDTEIKLSDLEAWHDFCVTNGFEFNLIIDFATDVREMLETIASAGRATPSQPDGLWSVVIDDVRTVPRQHVSPRNSFGFRGQKIYQDRPHALRIEFNNEDKDYRRDERLVFDDGFDENNATRIESLQLQGITSPDLIWKHGRFHIAQIRLRPEIFEFNMDIEWLALNRGDLFRFTHDVPLLGVSSGRITAVNDDTVNVVSIDVDENCPMETGKTYQVRIRTADDSSVLKVVNTVSGDNAILTFTTPFAIGSEGIAAGDLFQFGETALESIELKVQRIEPGPDETARIVAVEAAPAIQDADTGAIPPFDSKITEPFSTGQEITIVPEIESVISDEAALVRESDGSLRPSIVINLKPVSLDKLGLAKFIQVQWRGQNTDERWRFTDQAPVDQRVAVITEVIEGEQVEFRVRYTGALGEVGPWTGVQNEAVIGKSNPPADVMNFTAAAKLFGILLSWDDLPDPDRECFEIRQGGTGWGDATVLTCVDALAYTVDPQPAGQTTFRIKAIDTATPPNVSVNATSVTLTITANEVANLRAQVIDNNVLLQWDNIQGTFEVDHYEIRQGAAFATAEAIGDADATVDLLQELTDGVYTYWVVPVDRAGNLGVEKSITVTVDAPPGFIFRAKFDTDWIGNAKTNLTKNRNAITLVDDRTSVFLDGVDDLIDLDPAALNGATDFTAECWFRISTDFTQDHALFSAAHSGQTNEFLAIINAPTSISVLVRGTEVQFTASDGVPEIMNNEWHHLAVVRDDTADDVELFIDGVSKGSKSAPTGALTVDANGFVFGQDQDSVGGGFHAGQALGGYGDDIRIWSDVRTPTEIADNMSTELVGDEAGLELYHRLNEGQGDVTEDLSGNDRDGNIIGAAWHAPDITALAPVNTTETWEDHFANNSWADIQDAVDAGFAFYAQPTPASATFTAYYDVGTVVPSSRIIVNVSFDTIDGTISTSAEISTREAQVDSWSVIGTDDVFATGFRYVRVVLTITGSNSEDLARLNEMTTTLRTKQKSDSGRVEVTANPTSVLFNVSFIDVDSITITYNGTSAKFATRDFNDVPNPTGFDAYLFNSSDGSDGSGAGEFADWHADGI